jgi:hypothetical protein
VSEHKVQPKKAVVVATIVGEPNSTPLFPHLPDARSLLVLDEAVDTVSGAHAALATYGSINFPDSEFDRSSSSRSELLTQASNPGKTLNAVGQGDVWGIR